jgi:hypothetical protein
LNAAYKSKINRIAGSGVNAGFEVSCFLGQSANLSFTRHQPFVPHANPGLEDATPLVLKTADEFSNVLEQFR